MSNKEENNEINLNDNEISYSKDLVLAIDRIKLLKQSIELTKEELSNEIEAVAKKIGVKKQVLTRRIDLIIAEEGSGKVLKDKLEDIKFTEQYFENKNNLS